MSNYAYVNGTSGSQATITFNGPLGSPTAYNNLGSSGSSYKTIGFTYVAPISSTVTFNIIPSQGSIDVYYILSQFPPNSPQNFIAQNYYNNTSLLNTTNLGPNSGWNIITSSQVNTFNINPNQYLTIIFSKNGAGNGIIASTTTACFHSKTLILMGDNTWKPIKNIEKYDEVMTNIETNEKMIVSRNIPCILLDDIYKIPKGLLNNSNEIIVRGIHPIWINDNERCMVKDILGVIKISNDEMKNEVFYNIQFDIESTYYAESIKVDSLSPYHKKIPLCKENFIDKKSFISDIKILNENDAIRNKPTLVNRKVMPQEIITYNK